MGSRIINRIIPMRTFNYYRHGDEDINLLQACYENPLFDEDGTVLNDSRRKVPGQVDGIRTKGLEVNSVQTSVHYSPHDSSKWKALKVFAVIVAVLALIGIIVGIIVGQRQSKYIFIYSKICVKRPLSKDRKLVFKTNYRLMQVKSVAKCSKAIILQYFRLSLSYNLPLRSLFCIFLSCRFTQVSLYMQLIPPKNDFYNISYQTLALGISGRH